MEGKAVVVDDVPNQRMVTKDTWDWGYDTITWVLAPQPTGTRLIRIFEAYISPFPAALEKP